MSDQPNITTDVVKQIVENCPPNKFNMDFVMGKIIECESMLDDLDPETVPEDQTIFDQVAAELDDWVEVKKYMRSLQNKK